MNTTPSNNSQQLLQEQVIAVKPLDKKQFAKFIKKKRGYDDEDTKTALSGEKRHRRKKSEPSIAKIKPITTRELAERLGISYEQFRKIVNMQKPTPRRDCIIAICAALWLDSSETNEALMLYNYMPMLDTENPRDDELITILEEQLTHKLTIPEINNRLIRNGYPELDIIDHRDSAQKVSNKTGAPFKLIKKQVDTYAETLFWGSPSNSLVDEYSTERYSCISKMWLEDINEQRVYLLTNDRCRYYNVQITGHDTEQIQSFVTIESSGIFKDYFLELDGIVNRKLKEMLAVLNDTKNYRTRVSAGILNDAFHVYGETFNYTVPELNEYYLFEYRDGCPLLSVYERSEFMRLYLSPDEYTSTYGKNPNKLIAQYKSLDELNVLAAESRKDHSVLFSRFRHFKMLQEKVDNLLSMIRNGKRHVRDLDFIYDDRDRACRFFQVDEKFKCKIIVDDGVDYMKASVDAADFTFDDCGTVRITTTDIHEAFEYGFHDIHEICRVKKRLGSISKILS